MIFHEAHRKNCFLRNVDDEVKIHASLSKIWQYIKSHNDHLHDIKSIICSSFRFMHEDRAFS